MTVANRSEIVAAETSLLSHADDLLTRAERLAQTPVAPAVFYREVLRELIGLVHADGAAIWTLRDRDVSLIFDTEEANTAERAKLAVETIGAVEPNCTTIVPPLATGQLPNRLECARCISCLSIAPALQLALDIRMSVESSRRESLADVVTAVASVFVEFHRGRQLARLSSLIEERSRITAISHSLHGSLFRSRIALELANDGAAALQVDRICVLLSRGGQFELEAATAVGEINPRANACRTLEQLVHELSVQNLTLPWTNANLEIDLPIIHSYLAESGVTHLRVEPLGLKPGSWNDAPAVAVFEMFGSEVPQTEFDLVAEVCRHAAIALNNAATFEAHGFTGWLRRWKSWTRSQRTRATAWIVAAVLLLLIVIPADFDLEAHGQVQPVLRRQIFAPEDGIITTVPAEHGKTVAVNDVLIVMRNPLLELDEQRIRGDISAANARLASIRSARIESDRRSPTAATSAQLAAEEEELKQTTLGLTKQLEILKHRVADLTLRAPIAGQVVRSDLTRSLESRPVKQGQMLLRVIDPAGPWQLELRIPDRSVRHVLSAHRETTGLPVHFLFRMSPGSSYSATLDSVNLATDVDQNGELSTLATVAVQQTSIPNLRPGSSVIAKIHCGRRPLGYVWLREFWEFVQTRILF